MKKNQRNFLIISALVALAYGAGHYDQWRLNGNGGSDHKQIVVEVSQKTEIEKIQETADLAASKPYKSIIFPDRNDINIAPDPLLRPVTLNTSAIFNGGVYSFDLADHFSTQNAKVKISYVDPNVYRNLPAVIFGEQSVPLAAYDLADFASDHKIISELQKRHNDYNLDMRTIWLKMREQAAGENGDLLTNGRGNLFYTYKFVVYVYWGDGWHVYAYGQDSFSGWLAGDRVFSYNSFI